MTQLSGEPAGPSIAKCSSKGDNAKQRKHALPLQVSPSTSEQSRTVSNTIWLLPSAYGAVATVSAHPGAPEPSTATSYHRCWPPLRAVHKLINSFEDAMRRRMPVTVFAGDSASGALTGHSASSRSAAELVIGRRSLSREHMTFVK